MNVQELIKKVENTRKIKKEYDFSKHLTTTYIPYLEKLNKLTSVVDLSSYKTVNGKKVYWRDTTCMLFAFSMKMVEMYTDIEIGSVIDDYDALRAAHIFNSLLGIIPEDEYSICKNILTLTRDDLEYNTRELVPFLETKMESIAMGTDSIISVLEQQMEQLTQK